MGNHLEYNEGICVMSIYDYDNDFAHYECDELANKFIN